MANTAFIWPWTAEFVRYLTNGRAGPSRSNPAGQRGLADRLPELDPLLQLLRPFGHVNDRINVEHLQWGELGAGIEDVGRVVRTSSR